MRNVDLSGAQKVGAEGARKKNFSIDSKKDEWSSPEKEKVSRLSAGAFARLFESHNMDVDSTKQQKKLKRNFLFIFLSVAEDDFHSLENLK